MKTRILRALPATLAVVVIAAGAAFAAGVAGGSSPASSELASTQSEPTQPASTQSASTQSASARPASARSALDDDGTADQGSGDVAVSGASLPSPSEAASPSRTASATMEDRPLRTEHRHDDDRSEIRTEVRHSGTRDYAAADAGAVTVARDGATLTVRDVAPSGGWSSEVEHSSGREVEVTFRRDGRRVDFKAEVEHDRVEVRVRQR